MGDGVPLAAAWLWRGLTPGKLRNNVVRMPVSSEHASPGAALLRLPGPKWAGRALSQVLVPETGERTRMEDAGSAKLQPPLREPQPPTRRPPAEGRCP